LSDNDNSDYRHNLADYDVTDYVGSSDDDDDAVIDFNGHGSHIAGVIYDLTTRFAPQASIDFDIRKTHDALGIGYESCIVQAIYDAVQGGTDIINLSFSYADVRENEAESPLRSIINYAEERGVLVITAAGNAGVNNDATPTPQYPASFSLDNILSVASVKCNNRLTDFSNYGPVSTDLAVQGQRIPGPDLNSGVQELSGTSFSTAIVTAMAAILGSRQSSFEYSAIACALSETSDVYPYLSDKISSGGVINFQNAFDEFDMICGSSSRSENTPDDAISGFDAAFNVSPVPFTDQLQVHIGDQRLGDVSIYLLDQQGSVIRTLTSDDQESNITIIHGLHSLPSGMYMIKVITSSGVRTVQLMK